MTQEQIGKLLEKVATRIVMKNPGKYVFGYNSVEDIIQQGVYKGLEIIAEGKYKPEKYLKGNGADSPETSMMRFMSVHIRRRLINYKRDNMRREMGAVNLGDYEGPGVEHEIENQEMVEKVKRGLSNTPGVLSDFMRMLDGLSLPAQRKELVREKVWEILYGDN